MICRYYVLDISFYITFYIMLPQFVWLVCLLNHVPQAWVEIMTSEVDSNGEPYFNVFYRSPGLHPTNASQTRLLNLSIYCGLKDAFQRLNNSWPMLPLYYVELAEGDRGTAPWAYRTRGMRYTPLELP